MTGNGLKLCLGRLRFDIKILEVLSGIGLGCSGSGGVTIPGHL